MQQLQHRRVPPVIVTSRSLGGFLLFAFFIPFTVGQSYPALHVWPQPTSVVLPTAPIGPYVASAAATTIHVDPACAASVKLSATSLLKGPTTTFQAPTRTYSAQPYEAPDSYCPAARQCTTDSNCKGGGTCFLPSDRRWNSTTVCPPSTPYNTPCGCCLESTSVPTFPSISVSCSNASISHNEGYYIDVQATGIRVSGGSSTGASYGLLTLEQLLRFDSKNGFVVDFVPLEIADEPLYEWRGYMLDTSRHFIPINDILNLLDIIHAGKLNIFHWHMVDSPSFPYESIKYPELAKEGSWSQSSDTIYSQDDIKSVVSKAEDLFIKVVIEIDTPAHTLAIAKSHPEMMTDCWEWMADSHYKVDVDSDDCLALDPTNNKVRAMISEILSEVADLEGTFSPYVHIGGDEVKFPCWNSSESIQATVQSRYGDLSTTSFARLQAEWTANVSASTVVSKGKIPVLWQPTTQGPGDPVWDHALPDDSVYMVWLNSDSSKAYAQANRDVVYTTPFYVAAMGSGGWNTVYNAKIMPDGLTPEQQKHILGAEICMWGESLSAANLPVLGVQISAAAAENFWTTHPTYPGPGSSDGLGVGDRYNRFLCFLQRYGSVPAPPIMPSHCAVVDV